MSDAIADREDESSASSVEDRKILDYKVEVPLILAIAMAALFVLGIGGVAVTAVFVADGIEFQECQRNTNSERARAAELDRSALRSTLRSGADMINVLLDPAATLEQRREQVALWGAAQRNASIDLTKAEEIRKQHPLNNC